MFKKKIILCLSLSILSTGLFNVSVGEVIKIKDKPVAIKQEPIKPTIVQIVSRGNIDRGMDIPNVDTSFKTYMDYRKITKKSSPQYKLQRRAWTDDLGFRRFNDDYMVAMGTYYAKECGARFRITLDSGKTFTAIVSDNKKNKDTDRTHRYMPDTFNVVEFIVNAQKINKLSRSEGDMQYSDMKGKIIKIEKLEGGNYNENES